MKLRVDGEGPLVIKLAGLASGVELYREEMDAAVAAGFRVAALDTSGDRRDDPAPGPVTWDLLTGDVERSLDELGERRAVLWGTSFGCHVALAAATRFPDRVAGLLLCVPPDLEQPALHGELLRWALDRPDPVRGTLAVFRVAMALLCGWEFLSPAAMRRSRGLVARAVECATPAVIFRDKARLLLEEPLPPPPPGIATAIVAARLDAIAPCFGARRLARRLRGVRVRAIGGAGHCVAWARPRAYLSAVVEELKALATTR
jgi:3-oxoadipate enol-lactonase/3-oxoadipate enol-lactonase/4-carboxymuconolactone decarboxylase